jgi:uncharacterized protein VirK/YbjX
LVLLETAQFLPVSPRAAGRPKNQDGMYSREHRTGACELTCGMSLKDRDSTMGDACFKSITDDLGLESLSNHLHPKKQWSPALLAGVVRRALLNLRGYREVRQLLKLPPYAEAVQNNPKFAVFYLTELYLVRGFAVPVRAACFIHHYRRLHVVFPERILRQVLHWDLTLHEFSDDADRFEIAVGLSRPCDKEGELSLNLKVNGEIVFILSFTIVPGWVVKSDAAETILITRLQGMQGCYAQIRLATKAMRDVAPDALLLAALQGMASALGIPEIAGICGKDQISYCKEFAPFFKDAYDDFFSELGIARNVAGFFLTPAPVTEKPLGLVKRGHKLRTREKRFFKQQIQSACAASLLRFIAGASDHVEAVSPAQEPAPARPRFETVAHSSMEYYSVDARIDMHGTQH